MSVRSTRKIFLTIVASVGVISALPFSEGITAQLPKVPGEYGPVALKDPALRDLRLADYPAASVAELRMPTVSPKRLDEILEYNSSSSRPLMLGVERRIAEDAPSKSLPELTWMAVKDGGVGHFAVT